MPSFRWSIVLAVTTFAACGGGGDGGPNPQAGSLVINAGDDQVAAAGTALPDSLAVLVRDDAAAPLPGFTVTWTAATGGGSVSPTSSVSDAAGIAKTRRTLGPNAGTQTTSAAAAGAATVTFDAVAQIQGAVNIANATAPPLTDTVTAVKAESLTVTVTDHLGAPVEGIQVNWASVGGSVSAAQVATNAAGQSKVRFTYGTAAGNQTATATVTGLVNSPITITLNATAGTAVTIVKTAGDNLTSAPSSQVMYTVQSRDSHGNPKGGVTIDWAVGTGGGSITPAQNTTATNGNATATRTLGTGTGAQTATATASALATTPEVTFTTTSAIITTVEVRNNNTFFPTNVTINAGNTVTWEWQGVTQPHNVTFASVTGAPTNIPDRNQGSVARTFNTAGTFNYTCTNHAGMDGTVTVNP